MTTTIHVQTSDAFRREPGPWPAASGLRSEATREDVAPKATGPRERSERQEPGPWRLARYGEPVRWTSECVSLAGRGWVWLVAAGGLDLFAVGTAGRWHPLGRLGAGTLLPASAPGPDHILVGRPLPGCALHRLTAGALIAEPWTVDRAGFGPSATEDALVNGVDAGLAPLLSAVDVAPPAGTSTLLPGYRVELAPGDAARPVHGIVWIRVLSGRVGEPGLGPAGSLVAAAATGPRKRSERHELGTGAVAAIDDAVSSASGAVLAVGTTADLLASGSLWRLLAGEELRLRYALDRRLADCRLARRR